jgi:secreted trypsin-like serine protease
MTVGRLAIALFLAAMHGFATAGTIRHDRSDIIHRSGSKTPELAAVVQLMIGGQPSCSGTLIAPQWVLTASHCIWTSPNSPVYAQQTVVVAGQRFTVGPDDIFIHPDWAIGGFNVLTTSGDIALIRLPKPVLNVKPIAINRQPNEVGQTAYIGGFGTTGTGLTGNTIRTAVNRMGMNDIDATVAPISFPDQFPFQYSLTVGSTRALLTDFDNPSRSASSLGNSEPLNLEYTTAQGDSGGPLFLYKNRVFTVAGVTSGGIDGFAGTANAYSFYSDVATFTRVVSYVTWIDTAMSGRGRNLRQYFEQLAKDADGTVRAARLSYDQTRAELGQLGWRLQARTWLGDVATPRPGLGYRPTLRAPQPTPSELLDGIVREFQRRGGQGHGQATTAEDGSLPSSPCACQSQSTPD